MAAVIAAVLASGASVFGQNDWRAEFDDICSRTEQAMDLSKEELRVLIERCDRLKPGIEKLEETEKKVYLRRLQLCRNLFAFALDSLSNK
ncbi:MAG: hypothetical protein HZA15_00065 [Nitrospirae bacterium]|nr:hypothetical protein [Nitrospirota bacterium]